MKSNRFRGALALGLLVASWTMPLMVGCGGGVPETGTQVSPVKPEEAASQNKAMEEMRQSKNAKK